MCGDFDGPFLSAVSVTPGPHAVPYSKLKAEGDAAVAEKVERMAANTRRMEEELQLRKRREYLRNLQHAARPLPPSLEALLLDSIYAAPERWVHSDKLKVTVFEERLRILRHVVQIEQNERRVTVFIVDPRLNIVYIGTAVAAPDDPFHVQYGILLAAERAMAEGAEEVPLW